MQYSACKDNPLEKVMGLAKRLGVSILFIAATAIVLSLLWKVPYIFTLLGLSTWALFGHIITADEDRAGGWSNPDGNQPFPWSELVLKAAVFASLWALIVAFPQIKNFGS